jgi:hypothetical protein
MDQSDVEIGLRLIRPIQGPNKKLENRPIIVCRGQLKILQHNYNIWKPWMSVKRGETFPQMSQFSWICSRSLSLAFHFLSDYLFLSVRSSFLFLMYLSPHFAPLTHCGPGPATFDISYISM